MLLCHIERSIMYRKPPSPPKVCGKHKWESTHNAIPQVRCQTLITCLTAARQSNFSQKTEKERKKEVVLMTAAIDLCQKDLQSQRRYRLQLIKLPALMIVSGEDSDHGHTTVHTGELFIWIHINNSNAVITNLLCFRIIRAALWLSGQTVQ